MKLLDIRLKNLNSLRGEWHIDLTSPEYTSDGIFAVTGPTGAGKTTIFDAVCLALYGRTPRLVSNDNNAISEIMSKHTRYSTARVRFEAGGKIYVSEWSMTKNEVAGKAVYTINRTLNDNGVEEQKYVSARVTEITGLNFRQFTQAALLAQGEFDAFLSGSDTERAKILELLTGTEDYSKISTKIVEHTESAKAKLDVIRAQRDAMTPKDDFRSHEEISRKMDETHKRICELKNERTEIDTVIRVLREIRKLEGEIEQNQRDIACLEGIISQSHEKRLQLDAGIRAREIQPMYEMLTEKRRQYRIAQDQHERSRREADEALMRLSRIESELIPEHEERLTQLTRNIPEGESPASISAKVKSSLDESMRIYRQRTEYESDKSKAEEAFTKIQAEYESARSQEETARANHERTRARVSELMNMRVTATLNDKRMELKPGDICPLCGSVVNDEGLCSVSGNAANDGFRYDDELESARRKENDALRQAQEAGQKVSRLHTQRESCETSIEHYRKSIIDCDERRLAIRLSVQAMIEPLGIVGVRSCEGIISRVEKWYTETVNLEREISELRAQEQSLIGSTQARSKQLEEEAVSLSAMKEDLDAHEEKFAALLRAKNFPDEKQFTASILTDVKMTELQNEAQNHDDEMKRYQAIRQDRMRRLESERSKAVPAMTLEEAEELFTDKNGEIDSLRKRLGSLEEADNTRMKLQSEYDRLNSDYKAQEKKYNEWAAFSHRLDAKKSGGKFSKFAQRITLRMLVQLSNVQLQRMNSRYTLMLTPNDNELGLSVRDSEQAGEIRPTSNLSGGERFIISLALALGLSQISGSKVRVDSLFIDEGFGSLDEDALNSALEALSEIRREGRMIGIISHVSGISERIPAKIRVIPKSEGTSIITGPGCSSLRV